MENNKSLTKPISVLDLLLDKSMSYPELRSMITECLNESYDLASSNFLFKWFKYHEVRGLLIKKIENKKSMLTNAGIDLIDFNNPLHLISALHPNRGVRLSALKLARKLDINITEICNFKCQYCYQHSRDDDWEERANESNKHQMSLDLLKKLIDDSIVVGVKKIKFTGGEPLANPIFLDILEYAYSNENFVEVELVSNLSLLYGKRLERLKSIVGSGSRFHIHLSIDGFDENAGSKNKEKIFSSSTIKGLKTLFLQDFPDAIVSVNTMWTQNFTISEQSYKNIYSFLSEIKPKLWSISLPYLVKDIVNYSKIDTQFVPDFDRILEVADDLINIHRLNNYPFAISIPLLYKHEISGEGYMLSSSELKDYIFGHPCFPCHGSYFIVGPYGNVFDCLLLSKSQSTYKGQPIVELMRSASLNNNWFNLSIETVSSDCVGCRYEKLCKGQCPNDRYNGNDGKFGRDKSACSMLVRAETVLWKHLSKAENKRISSLLNQQGFIPATYFSLASIINGDSPITFDKTLDGDKIPNTNDKPIKKFFHQ